MLKSRDDVGFMETFFIWNYFPFRGGPSLLQLSESQKDKKDIRMLPLEAKPGELQRLPGLPRAKAESQVLHRQGLWRLLLHPDVKGGESLRLCQQGHDPRPETMPPLFLIPSGPSNPTSCSPNPRALNP